jgi:hypothetical protein
VNGTLPISSIKITLKQNIQLKFLKEFLKHTRMIVRYSLNILNGMWLKELRKSNNRCGGQALKFSPRMSK